MNRALFFSALRKRDSGIFGTSLSQKQVDGIEAILAEAERRKTPLVWLAYILATAYHETAGTMQPIAEYGKGKGRKYGVKGKYNQIPYGRGYVQLTWDFNYEKADKELGLRGALLHNFDLAMKPDIAAKIMFDGMEHGWFTGKSLGDYQDYVPMRRIINGTDKANQIAKYARTFEAALRGAGYGLWAQPKPVAPEPAKPVDPRPEITLPPVNPPALKMNWFKLIWTALAAMFRRN